MGRLSTETIFSLPCPTVEFEGGLGGVMDRHGFATFGGEFVNSVEEGRMCCPARGVGAASCTVRSLQLQWGVPVHS